MEEAGIFWTQKKKNTVSLFMDTHTHTHTHSLSLSLQGVSAVHVSHKRKPVARENLSHASTDMWPVRYMLG